MYWGTRKTRAIIGGRDKLLKKTLTKELSLYAEQCRLYRQREKAVEVLGSYKESIALEEKL